MEGLRQGYNAFGSAKFDGCSGSDRGWWAGPEEVRPHLGVWWCWSGLTMGARLQGQRDVGNADGTALVAVSHGVRGGAKAKGGVTVRYVTVTVP